MALSASLRLVAVSGRPPSHAARETAARSHRHRTRSRFMSVSTSSLWGAVARTRARAHLDPTPKGVLSTFTLRDSHRCAKDLLGFAHRKPLRISSAAARGSPWRPPLSLRSVGAGARAAEGETSGRVEGPEPSKGRRTATGVERRCWSDFSSRARDLGGLVLHGEGGMTHSGCFMPHVSVSHVSQTSLC